MRDRVRARAKERGRSMSQYILELIDSDLRTMTWDEYSAWLRKRGPIPLKLPKGKTLVDILHEARREEGWE